jgi:DNA-binding CsgD family transcriptional regulator
VLDLLTRLVDKSLVQAEAPPGGAARYRLLETLRQYARRRLADSGEAEAVHDRHAAHFAAAADQAGSLQAGGHVGGQMADLPASDAVEADLDNFRAALRWCLERPQPEIGLRLAWRLARLWYRRGRLTEAREWLAAFLAVPAAGGAPADLEGRQAALAEAAELARFHGDHPAAAAYCRRWLALAGERGDRGGVARALAGLGLAALAAREYAAARSWLAQSLPYARHVGDPTLSEVLGQLALTAWLEGDLATARARFDEGLAGGPLTASTLWGRFYLALEERDFGRARELLPAMARRVTANPGHRLTALYESARGSLALAEGDHAAAGAAFRLTAAAWRAAGDRGGVAFVLAHVAALAAARGQAERAARVGGAARRQLERFGGPYSPVLQAWLERLIARATPPPHEGELARAWAEGRAMTAEQAVADAEAVAQALAPARDEVAAPPGVPAAAGRAGARATASAPLTRREHEVAALVAQGLTNPQIAVQLVITTRTAGSHLEHIMNKLGVHSRAAVTAWVVEQRGAGAAGAAGTAGTA